MWDAVFKNLVSTMLRIYWPAALEPRSTLVLVVVVLEPGIPIVRFKIFCPVVGRCRLIRSARTTGAQLGQSGDRAVALANPAGASAEEIDPFMPFSTLAKNSDGC